MSYPPRAFRETREDVLLAAVAEIGLASLVVVQAHGVLSVTRDPAWLATHLARLTDAREAGRPEPWSIDDAPADFITGLRRGIVGLTLRVARLEGVWKIAQHHPEPNRRGVIAGLAASGTPGDRAMAAVMEQTEYKRQAGIEGRIGNTLA